MVRLLRGEEMGLEEEAVQKKHNLSDYLYDILEPGFVVVVII